MSQPARAACVVASLLTLTAPAAAFQRAAVQPPVAAQAVAPPRTADTAVLLPAGDAENVRDQFYQVLQKYPPALGRILKLDPSLMANEAYLAPYPGVAAFLAEHPEISRNPAYFLESVGVPDFGYVMDADAQRRRYAQEMLAAFAAFVVFLVVTGVIIWIIRMVIEARRWNRVSRTQAEVHTKLLDRFTNNEDLLAYIQTPAGRRFLESGPSPLPEDARPIGAPISRILLSVQTGIILIVAALGLLFLSRKLDEQAGPFLLVSGVVALAIGIGFLLSSGAAFAISRRLGLLNQGDSGHA